MCSMLHVCLEGGPEGVGEDGGEEGELQNSQLRKHRSTTRNHRIRTCQGKRALYTALGADEKSTKCAPVPTEDGAPYERVSSKTRCSF